MQLDCRHLRHPAKQQVMQFSLDRVVNPLSRLVYASNCGGLQPSQINCVRHECLGVSSPPVESNSPGCSDEAAGATGIVVRRTGVRRKASITGKWLSIRKAWWPHFRRHDSRIQSWLNPFCSSRRVETTLWQQFEVPRFDLSDALVPHGFMRPLDRGDRSARCRWRLSATWMRCCAVSSPSRCRTWGAAHQAHPRIL